jgi:outer membrane protein W
MKFHFTAIALLLSVSGLNAQAVNFKHFEVKASVNFWTPASLSLKTSNSLTQLAFPDGTYSSSGALSGYGTATAPGLQFQYYFNNNIGVSAGLILMNMDNELSVKKTDSTYSNYENMAQIANITLGVSARYPASESLHLFYEAGIVIVPNYDLNMHYSDESSSPPDMEAIGEALGLYGRIGAGVRIVSSLYFNAALASSFIPVEMEYTNGEKSAKINEKTNLGGIWLETGLSFNF